MQSSGRFCEVIFLLGLIEWSIQDTESNVLKRIFSNSHSDLRTLISPRVNESSNEPVPIHVNLFIRSIEKLDDRYMEMKAQITVRMSWLDPRLSYQYTEEMRKEPIEYVTFTDTSKIWIPDVYFVAEKQAHDHNIILPNVFARVYPNGTVLYSRRITVNQNCPMDLRDFPFDSQICSIRLASYKGGRISLQWKEYDPVQLHRSLHMLHFRLQSFKESRIEIKSNEKYPMLNVDLHFSRDLFYYFKKYYLPVVVVVLISWIPLWLERVLILRIYIAISTVIFLGWYYTVQNIDLLISYNTALDSWNAANFIFVLLVALESIFITFMIKTNTNAIKRIHPDDSDEFKMLPTGPDKRKIIEVCDEKTDIDAEIMKIKSNFKICFINVHKEVQILDAAAKLFFPSSYSFFLFFYWIAY